MSTIKKKHRSDRRVLLGLAGTAANLGKEKVDTEGSVLVGQVALEFGDLFAQHLGGIADATDDTQTTGVGDSSGQLGTRSHVHACQQDGVVDLKQISDRGTDLFCFVIMVSIDVVAMCLCGALRQVEGDHMKIMGIVKDNLGRHLRGDAIMKVCGVKVMKK